MDSHRASGSGVAVVGVDHSILWADEAFAAMVGHARADLIGLKFEQITHPDDIDLDRHLAVRLLSGDLDRYEIEKRYVGSQGAETSIHLTATFVRDRSGAVLYGLAVAEPIKPKGALRVKASAPLTDQEKEMDRIRRAIMAS